jgi:DNA-binding FadR family transcriptional regulator
MTVARSLGVAIVTGKLNADAILPSEVELAGDYEVSRGVIREALRTLTDKGLIESKRKAGTRVRARPVNSLFQLRMIVEPAAAELAAELRTPLHLSRMGHALERMAEHGLATSEGQRADEEFHSILLEATANELLVNLSASISASVRWTTYFKYRSSRGMSDPMPRHLALFDAIAKSDPKAARLAAAALIQQAQLDTQEALATDLPST